MKFLIVILTLLYCKMDSVINEKHVFNILQFLAKKGTVKRNDMLEIVPSNAYLDKILPKLQKVGYATVETKTLGRKIIFISLTSKGRIVAENLKHIEEPRKNARQREVQEHDEACGKPDDAM